MSNPNSVVMPEVLHENKMNINSFLKQTYDKGKKEIENGVSYIREGIIFFKDEFSASFNNTQACFETMLLPSNNFIKDLTEIDLELQAEINKSSFNETQSNIVPIEIALLSPMEENY